MTDIYSIYLYDMLTPDTLHNISPLILLYSPTRLPTGIRFNPANHSATLPSNYIHTHSQGYNPLLNSSQVDKTILRNRANVLLTIDKLCGSMPVSR